MILSRQGNIDCSKGYDGFCERLSIDPFSYLIFQERKKKRLTTLSLAYDLVWKFLRVVSEDGTWSEFTKLLFFLSLVWWILLKRNGFFFYFPPILCFSQFLGFFFFLLMQVKTVREIKSKNPLCWKGHVVKYIINTLLEQCLLINGESSWETASL